MPKRLIQNGRWRDTLAWVCILGIIAFSVIRTQAITTEVQDTQAQQAADRCESSQQLRSATRANIKAVYHLAIAVVTPPPPPGDKEPVPMTSREKAALHRYLLTARDFRDRALEKVPAVSPGCEDYVQQRREDSQ